MLTLKYNPATMRFDCYKGAHRVNILSCGMIFNLYVDDEEVLVAGRIEHYSTNGYYFICKDGYVIYLYNGMLGALGGLSF